MKEFQLKSFFVFISKNKLFTAINVFGFAVSLTFVILFGVYTQNEFSVDHAHEKGDRIYRITNNDGTGWGAMAGPELARRLPEIESFTRYYHLDFSVEFPEKNKVMADIFLADSSFFNIFSFPFVEGDPATALQLRTNAVLTESFANKMFGNESPVGKSLTINGKEDFIVTGVVKDFKRTHFQQGDVIVPFRNLGYFWGNPSYTDLAGDNAGFPLYLLLYENADLRPKLAGLAEELAQDGRFWQFKNGSATEIDLEPLEKIYLGSKGGDLIRTNNRTFLSVIGATVMLILLFAVINYINLSVAQIGFRAKEAAMRRLLGGTRGGLFSSFVMESVLLCILSMALAVLFAFWAEPWFKQMMNAESSLREGINALNVSMLILGATLLGCLAGFLPGWVVSKYRPIEVVRGTFTRKTKMIYSRVLITFQYAITIVLIGCTITIIRQVNYMSKAALGYNKDYLIGASNFVAPQNAAAFKDRILSIAGVEDVTLSQGYPMGTMNHLAMTLTDEVNLGFVMMAGDSAFFRMLDFQVLETTEAGASGGYWINETGWKHIHSLDPVATERFLTNFPVKGILKDYHYKDFTQNIGTALIQEMKEGTWAWTMLFKVSSSDPYGVMRRIEEVYNEEAGGTVFDGAFLDVTIQQMYQDQRRLSTMLGSLAFVAIVIASLGMFAMATYFMRQRSREVAVRKVFGAMNAEVLKMLLTSFLKLVLVAFVLSVPVIIYFMRDWLVTYPYRISLSWVIFALSGSMVFLMALLSVSIQSIKATRANPIVYLKD